MDQKHWTACREMVKAIQENNCAAVEKLLTEGFDVDAELMRHKYAVVICIEYNNINIGKLLIKHGCSLSLKGIHGSTPLHLSVQLLNFDFVNLLLDSRADLSSIDDNGRTALHLAAKMGSLRMVELLMKNANPGILNITDKEGKTPFIHACTNNNEALVSYFIAKGCDVNQQFGVHKNTPLFNAISSYSCSYETIQMLLDAGADVKHTNEFNETPLLKAFRIVSISNFSSAMCTLFQKVCCLLIERGSDVNVRNALDDTPLHLAVAINDAVLVRKLLNNGSQVNAINSLGMSPLFYACRKGLQGIATILLNCGANSGLINLDHEHHWLLDNDFHLSSLNTGSVLSYIVQKSKECASLQNMCRIVIRENLPKDIEKSALLLPLPLSVVRFLQLVE